MNTGDIYQVIGVYFDAFQKLDWKTMQACYAEEAIFLDPVAGALYGEEVRAMWQMLLSGNRDIKITIKHREFDGEEVVNSEGKPGYYCKVQWEAEYVFPATGRKVVNKVTSNIRVEYNKIAEQFDRFGFHRWASQAFGIKGTLLGWTPAFRKNVATAFRSRLKNFIEKHYHKR